MTVASQEGCTRCGWRPSRTTPTHCCPNLDDVGYNQQVVPLFDAQLWRDMGVDDPCAIVDEDTVATWVRVLAHVGVPVVPTSVVSHPHGMYERTAHASAPRWAVRILWAMRSTVPRESWETILQTARSVPLTVRDPEAALKHVAALWEIPVTD